MSNIAIRAEGLSKRYRIGQRQQLTMLREVIAESLASATRRVATLGRPRPRADDSLIWALRDVSFEVGHGEAVGIIGRNGAGKSTLLKILSRITRPTGGGADIYGRVGSLLEVGTGFQPELTGRENIYLNGAILGMPRAEIRRKFDEIVAFAEIEQFIDTPVKRYSSGMYVRLAFAVAAHLEPEILIVDEVLAVGDVEFQKKCLGKMSDVAHEGRTVLFVSHNLEVIQRLCPRCMLFERGQLVAYGGSASVVARYLAGGAGQARPGERVDLTTAARRGTGEARFVAAQYSGLNPASGPLPCSLGPLELLLEIESDAPRAIGSLSAIVSSDSGVKLINADTILQNRVVRLRAGRNLVRLRIDQLYLNRGVYRLGLWLANPISGAANSPYDEVESALEFEVVDLRPDASGLHPGAFVPCEFEVLEAYGID
ncbi:MAG: ATP-binding cassette domain-containing protein [Kouleothrix sp.]|nr:ATP-binding cassette domain-containing protein [Kouleothrix sp.]